MMHGQKKTLSYYSECWHYPCGVEEMMGLKSGEYLFQIPLKLKFCMFSITDCCQCGNYHLTQNLWREIIKPVKRKSGKVNKSAWLVQLFFMTCVPVCTAVIVCNVSVLWWCLYVMFYLYCKTLFIILCLLVICGYCTE